MKKRMIPILVALLLSIAVVCCACADNKSSVKEPDNKIEQSNIVPESSPTTEEESAIKEAFVKKYYKSEQCSVKTQESVIIKGYYGRYNGALAVVIHCTELDYADCGVNRFTVDGVELLMNGGEVPYVFKNDAIYSINDAYEQQILTYDDILEVQNGLRKTYGAYYEEKHITVSDM